MKITHIYHSGFVIELERTVLIFDWYEGDLPEFDPDKKVYVFVTHCKADHYSPRIWSRTATEFGAIRVKRICADGMTPFSSLG